MLRVSAADVNRRWPFVAWLCNGSTIHTASEAQLGRDPDYVGTGGQPAPGGTYGTDAYLPPSGTLGDTSCATANWAWNNGIDYDYAVFLR